MREAGNTATRYSTAFRLQALAISAVPFGALRLLRAGSSGLGCVPCLPQGLRPGLKYAAAPRLAAESKRGARRAADLGSTVTMSETKLGSCDRQPTLSGKRLVIASLSAVLVGALVITYVNAMRPRRNLDRFLKEIATVEIGKTRLEDWRRQVERARISGLSISCVQRTCGIGLRAENTLLQKLRLAPRSLATAGVDFNDGVASQIYIALTIERRNNNGEWYDDKGVVVRQSTDVPSACHEHYDLSVKQRYGVGDRYWATVAMDSCVSAKDRAKAFAINGTCLTRIGGCKTVEAMLPKVFGKP